MIKPIFSVTDAGRNGGIKGCTLCLNILFHLETIAEVFLIFMFVRLCVLFICFEACFMYSGCPRLTIWGGCASCSHFPGNEITAIVKHFWVALRAGEMAHLLALLSLAEYWS